MKKRVYRIRYWVAPREREHVGFAARDGLRRAVRHDGPVNVVTWYVDPKAVRTK